MGCGASKAALVSEDNINIVSASRPDNRSDKLATTPATSSRACILYSAAHSDAYGSDLVCIIKPDGVPNKLCILLPE